MIIVINIIPLIHALLSSQQKDSIQISKFSPSIRASGQAAATCLDLHGGVTTGSSGATGANECNANDANVRVVSSSPFSRKITCSYSANRLLQFASSSSSSSSSSNLYIYSNHQYEPDDDTIAENTNNQRSRPFKDEVLIETSISSTEIATTTTTTTTPPLVETLPLKNPVQPYNPKPKILVLGSTGQIGRYVIKNLMSLQQELQIVAFVRDYDKACDVLYDELIREHAGKRRGMPTLQVVVMDLVPDEDVAGYWRRKRREREKRVRALKEKQKEKKKKMRNKRKKNSYDEDDDDEEYDEDDDEDNELEYAFSAASFYNENVEDYDFKSKQKKDSNNSKDEKDSLDYIDPYQPLYDAMQNATAVISTIGTIRETFPFIDYIIKPWRIFLNPDKWCEDPSHPYYVNYMVMKKVLDCAEREQVKRDHQWDLWLEANENSEDYFATEGNDDDNDIHSQQHENKNDVIADMDGSKLVFNTTRPNIITNANLNTNNITEADIEKSNNFVQQLQLQQHSKNKRGDRLRIIRISDLCVAKPPWDFIAVFTNILRSLVFQSQERCEKLLMKSTKVDTIVLRPGDLVDKPRDENKTLIEVDIDGYLPSPCYVGREDVAVLASIASLSSMDFRPMQQQQRDKNNVGSANQTAYLDENTTYQPKPLQSKQSKSTSNSNHNRKKAKHWNVAVGWVDKEATPSMKNEGRKRFKHDSMQKAFRYIVKEEGIRSRMIAKQQLRKNYLYKLIIHPIQKWRNQISSHQTKPYGLFVLLPMLFMVYPMMCSLAISIGSKIPFVQKFVLCVLSYLKPLWLMLIRLIRSGGSTGSLYNTADPKQLKKLII